MPYLRDPLGRTTERASRSVFDDVPYLRRSPNSPSARGFPGVSDPSFPALESLLTGRDYAQSLSPPVGGSGETRRDWGWDAGAALGLGPTVLLLTEPGRTRPILRHEPGKGVRPSPAPEGNLPPGLFPRGLSTLRPVMRGPLVSSGVQFQGKRCVSPGCRPQMQSPTSRSRPRRGTVGASWCRGGLPACPVAEEDKGGGGKGRGTEQGV